MLPSAHRLKKKNDFKRAFEQGKGLKEEFLFLKLIKNNLKVTRFGFVVGIKVSKKATVRNKIKRKLREAAKHKLAKMKKGFDVVLVAGKGVENKNSKEVEIIVSRLFKKAKII